MHEAAWLDSDRAFMLALAEHEQQLADELCPCGCGQPREVAWNPDSAGWWEVAHFTCQAGAAKAAYRAAAKLGPDDLTVVRLGVPEENLRPLNMAELLAFSTSTDEPDTHDDDT